MLSKPKKLLRLSNCTGTHWVELHAYIGDGCVFYLFASSQGSGIIHSDHSAGARLQVEGIARRIEQSHHTYLTADKIKGEA